MFVQPAQKITDRDLCEYFSGCIVDWGGTSPIIKYMTKLRIPFWIFLVSGSSSSDTGVF